MMLRHMALAGSGRPDHQGHGRRDPTAKKVTYDFARPKPFE
jgi:hypothetical protein